MTEIYAPLTESIAQTVMSQISYEWVAHAGYLKTTVIFCHQIYQQNLVSKSHNPL